MASSWREGEFGKRPARIANCSGYCGDPAIEMYKQATLGNVDFITGDYLAEVNIAKNAAAHAAGRHPGYEPTAWEGLKMSLDAIAAKRIKVAVNGGALDPRGLAGRIAALARERGLAGLRVAYVSGDDLRGEVGASMPTSEAELERLRLRHLDAGDGRVRPPDEAFAFLNRRKPPSSPPGKGEGEGEKGGEEEESAAPVVAANAYLGARGILTALRGVVLVGLGRPRLRRPRRRARRGASDRVLGVRDGRELRGVRGRGEVRRGVGEVKAVLDGVEVEEVGRDRVRVSGIKGLPPPPTTKLAIFYEGGYECQLLFNAAGYGWREKCELFEKQVRTQMGDQAIRNLDFLEFQRIGVPAENPWDQNSSTMYIRIVAQAKTEAALLQIGTAVSNISLRHFHGFHGSLDMRTAVPKPCLAFYPALWPQSALAETAHFVSVTGGGETAIASSHPAGHPPAYEPLGQRASYDTASPIPVPPSSATPTRRVRLGDKGANLNVGVFVPTTSSNDDIDRSLEQRRWDWLRTFLSRERLWRLLGGDAREGVHSVERVEFPAIRAVHFVVYGLLGRGVSSATRLDAFGKGFADYLRDKVVEVPVEVLGEEGKASL